MVNNLIQISDGEKSLSERLNTMISKSYEFRRHTSGYLACINIPCLLHIDLIISSPKFGNELNIKHCVLHNDFIICCPKFGTNQF